MISKIRQINYLLSLTFLNIWKDMFFHFHCGSNKCESFLKVTRCDINLLIWHSFESTWHFFSWGLRNRLSLLTCPTRLACHKKYYEIDAFSATICFPLMIFQFTCFFALKAISWFPSFPNKYISAGLLMFSRILKSYPKSMKRIN